MHRRDNIGGFADAPQRRAAFDEIQPLLEVTAEDQVGNVLNSLVPHLGPGNTGVNGVHPDIHSAELLDAHLKQLLGNLDTGIIDLYVQPAGDYADQPILDRFNGYKMAGNDPETPEITRIRLMIGQNRHKEVLEPLKSELKKAESSGYFRQTLLLFHF